MIESSPLIGVLKVALILPAAQSLKEKRMVLKSLKDRVCSRFNVSVAEIEHHEKWQRAVLAFCIAGDDPKFLDSSLQSVLHYVETDRVAQLAEYNVEIL